MKSCLVIIIYLPTINSPFPPSFSCLKYLHVFTYYITLSSRLFSSYGVGIMPLFEQFFPTSHLGLPHIEP